MFEKVFLSARGEIGARVARSIRRVGSDISTVRIAEQEDSVHLEECDESIVLGESFRERTRDPWLVIAAAKSASDVQALHPGFSLDGQDPILSRLVEQWAAEPPQVLEQTPTVEVLAATENADATETAAAPQLEASAPPAAPIRFIGPSPEDIVQYRDAHWMMQAALEAGLRAIEVSEASALHEALVAASSELNFPLVVRRAYAGFDSGQIVRSQEELARALDEDQGAVAHYLARLPERARHIEVYVVANKQDVVAVGEAETSVVRERRVMIAECPAPCLDALRRGAAVRSSVWEAAVAFVRSIGFSGVGVVHFALDSHGAFFFDGFSAGLRESHAAVESCSSIDLVEAELQIAFDGTLPSSLLRSEISGHAILATVDASTDPRTWMPFASRVDELRWPPSPIGRIRLESGVKTKTRILNEDAPTLATVTAYAPTRHEALLSLDRVLAEVRLAPVVSNVRVLRKTLNHESFRAATYDAGFVERLPAGL